MERMLKPTTEAAGPGGPGIMPTMVKPIPSHIRLLALLGTRILKLRT